MSVKVARVKILKKLELVYFVINLLQFINEKRKKLVRDLVLTLIIELDQITEIGKKMFIEQPALLSIKKHVLFAVKIK